MSKPERLALEDAHGVGAVRLQLLEHADYRLDIYLPALDHATFTGEAEQQQLRRIATSGRRARIRLLLHDAAGAAQGGHRLLVLAQRLPSVLQVRTPLQDSDLTDHSAFVLNDSGGYLLLPDASRPRGRASLLDRAAQAPLRQLFDQAWERSQHAVAWQRLDI